MKLVSQSHACLLYDATYPDSQFLTTGRFSIQLNTETTVIALAQPQCDNRGLEAMLCGRANRRLRKCRRLELLSDPMYG